MEFLFEILAELALQFFGFLVRVVLGFLANCALETAWAGFLETLLHKRNPVLSTIGFVVWGGLAGAVSLWPFPHAFIADHGLRLFNLALTPLVCAAGAKFAGEKLGQRYPRFVEPGRFAYALAFTFTMALVRFTLAR